MAEVRPLVDEESGKVFLVDSVFGTLRKNRDSVFLNKKIPRCARDSGEGKVDVMDSNKSPRCARETLSRLKTKHCPRMTLCLGALVGKSPSRAACLLLSPPHPPLVVYRSAPRCNRLVAPCLKRNWRMSL